MIPLLTARDVARLLGWSVDHWYRRRRALEAAGFPRPIPELGNRWDPNAIEAWLAARRGGPRAWEARLAARATHQTTIGGNDGAQAHPILD